ncbi:MAG: DNA-processing protein DprA [Rickettsiella sp.]|nr:DNA-processing protein DprA [Rickettsiella sp.]
MDELRDWLTLYTVPNCGVATVLKLLNVFLTPAALLSASFKALRGAKVNESLITYLKKPDWKRVDACLAWREKVGRDILHWHDPRYPHLLREIASPPLILFIEGDASIIQDHQLAIVGARYPTPTGLETAYQFASELAKQGLVITSGLARGIDSASHQGCLAITGKTIAVMGSGLNHIYPTCHQQLAQQIVEKGGALVSEFFPDSPPKAEHFPRRNRIISGLCLGILVVEAAMRSGSLITARFALEQGREVFAIPGSIFNPLSQGCHALLKQGATLIENSHDILLELSFSPLMQVKPEKNLEVKNETDSRPQLESDDIKLVECLGFETVTIDTLVVRTGLTTNKLLARLVLLELQGYISAVPGGYARK